MAWWGAILFVSLLAHELGHALAGLAFGSRAAMTLYPLGGITRFDPPLSRSRSLLATLAGPVTSLTIGLGAAALRASWGSAEWLPVFMWVNLGWGILNLLPVLPFDGGRAMLELVGSERASRALLLSALAALVVADLGFVFRNATLLLVFGGAALISVLEWAKRRRGEIDVRLGLPVQLETAKLLLAGGRYFEASHLAEVVATRTRVNGTQSAALEILAWSYLGLSRPEKARQALARARFPHAVDPYCRAAVEDASGFRDRAIGILQLARQNGGLVRESATFLIDLYARQGAFDQACALALAEMDILGADNARLVVEAALEANAFGPAAELAAQLSAATAAPGGRS